MGLLSVILKYFVMPGYNPTEDLIELGVDTTKYLLDAKNGNVDTLLEVEGLRKNQIETVKYIITQSTDRFIPNTPAEVYNYAADSMSIARQILKSFKKEQKLGDDISQTELCFTDETEDEMLIKGISLIVQRALDLCLSSPEYVEYLTRAQNIAATSIKHQDSQLKDHEKRIKNLEHDESQRISDIAQKTKKYNDHVMELYTKRIIGNELLGEESLSDMYMQLDYYKSRYELYDVEKLIDEFVSLRNYGVLWIVGEPGHGKTSMCIKAVVDYVQKKRYQSVEGVYWFRLNPQNIPAMVENQKLTLRLAFSWEDIDGDRSNNIEPTDIKGSLVFLDGFDELKSSMEKNHISDNQFYTQVNRMAEKNRMYIIVTSRMRALEQESLCTEVYLKNGEGVITCKFRDGGSRKNSVKLLAPLTEEKQFEWIDGLIKCRKAQDKNTSDLEEYRITFKSFQENKDVSELLKVPILLRMIVQNTFLPSSGNRVNLYRDLFTQTLIRQELDHKKEILRAIYQKIAYKIFVYDDDCAEIDKKEFAELAGNNAYLYQYYLYTPEAVSESSKKEKYIISFLHRSFYQYFLGEFLYEKLKKVNDVKSGEDFLKYLWARRLDIYVLENLYNTAKDECDKYKWVLTVLDKTDGFLSGYACSLESKENIHNYNKANNTFCNGVSIYNTIFRKENSQGKMKLSERGVFLLSMYNCIGVSLTASFLQSAELSYSNFNHADLSSSYLSSANLSYADLSYANLRSADLSFANLSSANLNSADLSSTNLNSANLSAVDLTSANLRSADLIHAQLNSANLRFAYLNSANLRAAKLNRVDLRSANLSSADFRYADLTFADLSSANFSFADLRLANLSSVDLRSADLGSAKLNSARLRSADLRSSQLKSANLSSADLRSADLRFADLSNSDLRSADLSNADLTNSILYNALFDGANVKNIKVTKEQSDYIMNQNVMNTNEMIIVDNNV